MRKNIKQILSVFLLFSILVTIFVSCKKDEKDDNSYKVNLEGYKVIRAYEGSVELQTIFGRLRDTLIEKTGIEKITFAYDLDIEDDGGCEILLGHTNRKASEDALTELSKNIKEEAFIIKVTDTKIIINGYTDENIMMGVNYFIQNFVDTITTKDKTISFPEEGYTFTKEANETFTYYNDGKNAMLSTGLTTIFTPEEKLINAELTYGKIIKLEHQSDSKKNGILIATNENSKGQPWDIYHSYDDGRTWQISERVVDTINKDMNPGYQPYLFELPVDIGSYKKGTILFSGCSYSTKGTRLPLFASTDQGKTWKKVHNIAEGGAFNKGGWTSDGVWEPCLVYDDKTERLYCFYSDEQLNGVGANHVGGYNQRLVYKYTTDLKTWSKEYNAVALEGDTRPGMPMVTKMGNGQWALVYENVGAVQGGTPIYIKFTDNITDWNPSDAGKLMVSKEGAYCGSSPAIAWTPEGGKCGTLIVTANGQVGGNPSAKCDLFISHDYGKTFVTVANPIEVRRSDYVRCAYSPGLFVDKEGTVYYVNNPERNPGDVCARLMFTKLKFMEIE